LITLSAAGCRFLSTENLETLDLPNLVTVDLSYSAFDRIAVLNNLPKLKELNLKGCFHLSTDGIDYLNLPSIQDVNITSSNFDRLAVLARLHTLTALHMFDCPDIVVDVGVHFELHNLRYEHLETEDQQLKHFIFDGPRHAMPRMRAPTLGATTFNSGPKQISRDRSQTHGAPQLRNPLNAKPTFVPTSAKYNRYYVDNQFMELDDGENIIEEDDEKYLDLGDDNMDNIVEDLFQRYNMVEAPRDRLSSMGKSAVPGLRNPNPSLARPQHSNTLPLTRVVSFGGAKQTSYAANTVPRARTMEFARQLSDGYPSTANVRAV